MSDLRGIQSLLVTLTASCNLTCGYCFQNRKGPQRMEWENLRRSLDLLLLSREPALRLVFFGGEPLLEFPLIKRAVAHVEERASPKHRLEYSIITNGTLLRGEVATFLREHEFTIQLSFDGVYGAQELRGRGTFTVLDRLLRDLRWEHHAYFRGHLGVNLTLLPATVDLLADSVSYFLDRDLSEISITPTITHASGWEVGDIHRLEAQYERILERSVDHFNETGRVPLKDFSPGSRTVPDGEPVAMCGVMRGETAVVDVDGTIQGCATFSRSYQTFASDFLAGQLDVMEVGALSDPDLPDRYAALETNSRRAPIFHDKQNKFSSYARCGDCVHLVDCDVCPVSIGNIPGNRDANRVPDFQCAFNLVRLSYRDRFIELTRTEPVRLFRRSAARERVRQAAQALRALEQ